MMKLPVPAFILIVKLPGLVCRGSLFGGGRLFPDSHWTYGSHARAALWSTDQSGSCL